MTAMTESLLVIYGAGAHARKVCHAWTQAGGRVDAFVDDDPAATSPVPGVALRSAASLETMPANTALFVAIGRADVRRRLVELYAGRGWRLPAVVHPRASVVTRCAARRGCVHRCRGRCRKCGAHRARRDRRHRRAGRSRRARRCVRAPARRNGVRGRRRVERVGTHATTDAHPVPEPLRRLAAARHGEYRPYYLAREWVRSGHEVQMIAGLVLARAHASTRPGRQRIARRDDRRHRLPLARDAGLRRQRHRPRAQHRGVPRAAVAGVGALGRLAARCRDRVEHLPDGHLGRAPNRAACSREAGLRSARSVARLADRVERHVASAPVHRAVPEGRERRLSRCRSGGVDAAEGRQAHGRARARPAQAEHRAERHLARRVGGRRRGRARAGPWPATSRRCSPRGAPSSATRALTPAQCSRHPARRGSAASRGERVVRARRRRPREGAPGEARAPTNDW